MKKLFYLVFLVIASIFSLSAQQHYGVTAPACTQAVYTEAYNTFKSLYFDSSCGDGKIRVKWGHNSTVGKPDETVSEGIAYGMLMAAYMKDQTSLDGLWKYYKSFPNSNGLMHWHTSGCGNVVEQNAATDAEEDAALALIVASYVFNTPGAFNYTNEAKWLIGQIRSKEIEGTVLKPGDMFGGASVTNISYFAPGYYKIFAEFTGDNSWNDIANKCYEIINNNQNKFGAKGGLVSDWCKADGSAADGKATFYSYDACRTPWRLAMDYYWFGDSRAKAYLDKTNAFITQIGGITEVKDGYNLDGTLISGTRYHNSTFVNAFACAGVATNQATVDAYFAETQVVKPWGYFDYCFDLFGKLTLSGRWEKPRAGMLSCSDVTLATIKINAPKTKLALNESITLTVTGESSCQTVAVPNLVWSANAPGGVFKNASEGVYKITASSGNLKSEIIITVTNDAAVETKFKVEAESYISFSTQIKDQYDKDLQKENNGLSIGYFNQDGETITYTVNVPATGQYDVVLKYCSEGAGNVGLKFGTNAEQLVSFAASQNSGNWWDLAFASWPTSAASKVNLTAGSQTMVITNKGKSINLDYLEFTTQTTSPDAVAPVITLLGSSTVTVKTGTAYADAGATATDNANGNLTDIIVTSSNVNTAIEGQYAVTYDVTDLSGNKATKVTRNVIVSPTTSLTDATESGIVIYPNPSNGVFNIKGCDSYKIEAYDIAGTNILTKEIGADVTQIDLGSRKGLFLLKISNETETYIERVIVK